jgi:hypothetical protein
VTHGALVLVDTSVWIRALGGREPRRTHLDEVLNRNEAVGHNLASAIAARMKLWTTDPRLDAVSAELGARYAD